MYATRDAASYIICRFQSPNDLRGGRWGDWGLGQSNGLNSMVDGVVGTTSGVIERIL